MFKIWQEVALWKRVIVALGLGLITGLLMRSGLGEDLATSTADNWIKPFGDAFVRLIKMLIVPLISTTLIVGVTAMGDPKRLGSLGGLTIGMYLLTTLFAVSLGLGLGTLIRPGVGVNYNPDAVVKVETNAEDKPASGSGVETNEDKKGEETTKPVNPDVEAIRKKLGTAKEAGTLTERLLNIIPQNPIAAMAAGDVLPTIFFSLVIGIGILFTGSVADPAKHFFESAAEVVMRVTMLVMELAPIGVFFLMAWVMAVKGWGVLSNMGALAIALYLACAIQIVFVYGGLIVGGVLRLPIMQFFKGIVDAQGVAYSTASSSATLPVTISCAQHKLGIDKSVAGSVLPLGATINMDGTAIYLGLVALFAVQAKGESLDMSQYFMVAMTATLVSIGAAGIPSAGLLLAATVLGVVGVESEEALLVIAFIFPFDRLLDMMRTVTNVSGDLAVACAVAKWEDSLDEGIFRADAELPRKGE